jgi:predicted transposase YdaD
MKIVLKEGRKERKEEGRKEGKQEKTKSNFPRSNFGVGSEL